MDIAGMGILLGYAIGRIGCQISGDGDWGIVVAAQPSWWFYRIGCGLIITQTMYQMMGLP